jgi:hypothetical protein
LVIGVAEQIVHSGTVDINLAGIAWLKGARLEFDDDIAPELEME